ncbi:folate-binding protein [Tropicimonas sp. TH_r6]|uniref:CAF17-like 4Fe-4S cluster assembly/insertion protein YgfZ n=1 Tax=Tropicimonas sp. TH_r6 TaxID=3082085 RepID=UPI00295547BE|nr:folate-binding protein [Tropicimonas sp. TH_r6]MDV7144510.1 folate-binding protein [Tropicimonas sp. TH_r6]
MSQRRVLAITGADRLSFLQGLVTNDVDKLKDGAVYAALLSPQGKYLADFFLVAEGERVLLDVAETLADDLVKRLSMYRLRADVQITSTNLAVSRGTGTAPEGALSDPRHDALGWRLYAETALPQDETDWDALRVAHCVPESGAELRPNESYILEAGFERLNGVDFRKGCYVGQEVTARMKHKTELKKGFATVDITGDVPVGTGVEADGKPVGQIFTQSGGRAIAYLRFDRAGNEMQAAGAQVTWRG